MTVSSLVLSPLRKVIMTVITVCCLSTVAYSQPNSNSIVTFSPVGSSVGPGDRIQITATLMDPGPAGPVATAAVDNTKFGWKLADRAHTAYVQILAANNILTVVGLNSPAGAPRPASIPIIATYIDAPPGPMVSLSSVINIGLATGLASPGVTATWDVLPPNVCKHSFGRSVGNDYYCIEVTITNHSGYDLQIADVSFTLAAGGTVSSTGYNIARNTLRYRNMFYPRAIILNTITALGPVLTGFTPYFHNLAHRGNFTEGINILSNPFEKGLEKAWPDPTGRYLDNFDAIVLREGVIVPNNAVPLKTRVFYPKRSLNLTTNKDNPTTVRAALGQLNLQGTAVQYVNSIRVTTP